MISRRFSDAGQLTSIKQQQPQPVQSQFNFNSINEKSNEKGKENERGTQEKNSFLLGSYDKYDNNLKYDYEQRDSNSKSKQIHSSQQRSTNKSRPSSPSFNPSPIVPPSQVHPPIPLTSSVPSQYQLLLQYELKRQKQKCQILQKRLNNKQEFIKEMKSIQQVITMAYAECQQELNQVNNMLYEMKANSAREIRDYKQQIEELRHQIALLQNGNKQVSNNESFKKQNEVQKRYIKSKSTINLTRHQSTADIDHGKITSVAKKSSLGNPQFVNLKLLGLNQHQNPSKAQYSIRQNVQNDKNMTRSNTHSVLVMDHNKKSTENLKTMKQMVHSNSQYSSISPIYRIENNTPNHPHIFKSRPDLSQFQIEITENISKVSNFLHHFIDMCQKMMEIQLQQNKGPNNHDQKESKQHGKTKLIHQLKKYWKWIKQVIKEWKDMKNQRKATKNKSNRQLFTLSKNRKKSQAQCIQDGQQFIETLGNQQTFQHN